MRVLMTPSRSKKIARFLRTASVGILVTTKHKGDRAANDDEIEQERPVLDVVEVVLDTALHRFRSLRRTAPTVHLRPTRNARLYKMSYHVLRDHIAIVLGVLEHVRSRTDDGHIATENIPKL